MSSAITLEVNGQVRDFSGGSRPETVAELVTALGLDAKTVVAEVNGDIVRREDFGIRALANGDKVEIVRFVGGG